MAFYLIGENYIIKSINVYLGISELYQARLGMQNVAQDME